LGLKKVFTQHYPTNGMKHKAGVMARPTFQSCGDLSIETAAKLEALRGFVFAKALPQLRMPVNPYGQRE
jgi:hypothetical protein